VATPARAVRELTRFDSLIVPHDLTGQADRVLPVVGELSRRAGLGVMLVTTASPGLETEDRADLASHGRRIHGALTTSVVLGSNDPADDLAAFAERHPYSLICLATHARTALGELVFGSMADDLLRRLARPILAVGPHVDAGITISDTLLVAVDSFSLRTELPSTAAAWRTTFGGSIELFEAVVPARNGKAQVPPIELREAALAFDNARLTTAESHDPARAIVEAASESRSVVAIDSHLRRGLERAVLGSVAWEVVRFSPTPVLIVPALGD